jgi:hypothetical protein
MGISMSREDLISIAKGAGIAAAGAALTYLSQWAAGTDFGASTPVVVAVLSVLTNTFRKWVAGGK